MSRPAWGTPPSCTDVLALAEAAFDALPQAMRDAASRIEIRVDEFADEAVLAEFGLHDPFELTGLYQGVPLTEDPISDPSPDQPRIWLYRRPILDEWAQRGDVAFETLVAHVLIHELGHHFGWSDAAMDAALAAAEVEAEAETGH